MATATIQPAFVSGEIAPNLFGRVDEARLHNGAATMRNMYVGYRGGAYSRAGTKFVGYSKQTGRSFPPRLIPFQFSINQGLALEFGNFYMRVVFDGAFVTETPISVTGATRANPCVLTVSALTSGVQSATPNNGAVTTSYAPGDTVTIAGGTASVPAILAVTNTQLVSTVPNAFAGSGYVPADTITLAGGTHSVASIVTISTTQVANLVLSGGGAGYTPTGLGNVVLSGTTGTGTKFKVAVHVNGFGVVDFLVGTVSFGSYTVNPTLANEHLTLDGTATIAATVNVSMAPGTVSVTTPGVYTVNPASGNFTQASTSGVGTGATFSFAVMGPHAATVANGGVYTAFPANPASQASTGGGGLGATFTLTTGPIAPFNAGDCVFVASVGGMTQLNGRTFVVGSPSGANFSLLDMFGNTIDSSAFGAYTSGGTVARIYTLPMPYAEQDLPYLKFTQSADVMSLTCVNQQTLTEYAPIDLERISDNQWQLSAVVAVPSVNPPAAVTGAASSGGSVDYQYVVTSVSPVDGTESVRSPVASINSAVDIASTAGTITVSWSAVSEVNQFNVYKATPGFSAAPPVGALFGFAGSAYGVQFIDSNIIADFSQVPPRHKTPFSRGQILGVFPTAGGSGYTNATATINSTTGSGAVITCVVVSGGVVAYIIEDAGQNYGPTDTVTITGDGTGAIGALQVGAQVGTYPSVVSYFQERRVYANTTNNPDTYFMSQPGAFKNFDSRIPTIDTDAITGTPWSVQVNGVQFMLQTTAGLLVMTGLSAWLLAGAGSFATNVAAISPSSQTALPQAFSGCSPIVPPIRINYDVLYVTSKGSLYYDLPYQLYALSEPLDLTENSSHLFTGFTIREHAWCEQPYKTLWSVRSDGVMLSLAFLKAQQVAGWARHDTNGLFQSVCSVTEPPIDALYLAVQRTLGGATSYMVERMDSRIWPSVEQAWCVDSALTLGQPLGSVSLAASSATGLGACSGVTGLVGGTGYSSATTASVVDDNGQGPGTGAVPALTIVDGVITGVSFSPAGTGYVNPRLDFTDPSNAGAGASAVITLDNSMTFTAGAAFFSGGNVGSVIRMGGGVATITAFINSQHVTANITSPIVATQPNANPTGTPVVQPQPAGAWTITAPVTTVSGLEHLAGAMITGLADGNVVAPILVPASGIVTLPTAASAITLGLGYQAQIQSVYLETGEPTGQGQRKKVAEVTARIEDSRGIKAGTNQPDGSTLSPPQLAPTWNDLSDVPEKATRPYNGVFQPLFTGDVRLPVQGGFQTPGQVALQQDNPLPFALLAIIPELLSGDRPEQKAEPRQNRGKAA